MGLILPGTDVTRQFMKVTMFSCQFLEGNVHLVSWGKCTAGIILPLDQHNWLKWSYAVACKGGGKQGASPGHPRSEITKISMLQLDDFFYLKSTNTRCMDLFFKTTFVVNTNFCIFTCQSFSHSSVQGTYTLSVRNTRNETDSDMIYSRSFDQEKITNRIEKQSVLTKTCF